MENLKTETIRVLEEHGKTISDIKWIGIDGCGYIDIDTFFKEADQLYDDGFGAEEVDPALIVVGNDWWLERHEYDGSEWWEYKELPEKPEEIIKTPSRIWTP